MESKTPPTFEVAMSLGEPMISFNIKYTGGQLNAWLTIPQMIEVRDNANAIIAEAYKKGYVPDE